MNKIISITAVFCGFFSLILFFMYNSLKKENIALETQINEDKAQYELKIDTLEREKENALAIADHREELGRAIKEDNSNFNWQYNISNSNPVLALKRMHANKG